MTHPAEPITIYNVAELAGKAYPQAFTLKNIQSGFRVTGIWPVDENVFGDDEFLCSALTDREDPRSATRNLTAATPPQTAREDSHATIDDAGQASTSSSSVFISPQEIRPYPKAKPRKLICRRKKIKSRILTDTPEKEELQRLHDEKLKKEQLKSKEISKEIDAVKSDARGVIW